MSFKKLALVSAMFAATSGAFAMEALDEEAMAATTGQDGITVTITTPVAGITMSQIIHDKNGAAGIDINGDGVVDASDVARAGAIVIGQLDGEVAGANNEALRIVLGGAVTLNIDADGGTATGSTPFLNINVGLTGSTTISTGDLRVASNAAMVTAGATGVAGSTIGTLNDTDAVTAGNQGANVSGVIMNSMDIVLGATTMNIQLGAEPQGAMIKLNTVMTGGLTINNFALNDASSSQSISMASQHIYNAGGTDLDVKANIDVTAGGLQVALAQFGHATNGASIDINTVRLGSAAAIGDIEIRGLNMNGTAITVAGH